MKKRWVLREKPDHEVVERLSKELNINTILTTLLIFRGITTYKDAKSFFRPQLTDLLDPFLMKAHQVILLVDFQ